MQHLDERARATLIGFLAIPLWGSLAVLTTLLSGIPPLQMLTVSFAMSGVLGTLLLLARGESLSGLLRQPPALWLLGIGAYFGYHLLFFLALRNAPVAEANLINYLWPLLIVLFSALLPGERLRPAMVIGALLGFGGAGLLIGTGSGAAQSEAWIGYAAALASALIWSGYSVVSRRFSAVPTGTVFLFCLATAALAVPAHVALEETVMPSATEWLVLGLLALGPLGAAFFLWDIGTKQGHLPLLGVLSYATPILSTLLLVAAGAAEAGAELWIGCALVTAGAVIASGGVSMLAKVSRKRTSIAPE
ncbi:MAG TPA: EamA family transporter [Allosphingosinicella sp.]|uniref:aromatic amino acid exporter YddG n=1 Tax=Allosphingosinicella sp. TaxID=2823234 RepID=UPI002ED7E4FA